MKDKEQEFQQTGHIYSSMKATLFELYPKEIVHDFLKALNQQGRAEQKTKEKKAKEKLKEELTCGGNKCCECQARRINIDKIFKEVLGV